MHVLRGDSSNDRASSGKGRSVAVGRRADRVHRQILAARHARLGEALPLQPNSSCANGPSRTRATAPGRGTRIAIRSRHGHGDAWMTAPLLATRGSRRAALVGILTLAVGALPPCGRAAADTQWQSIDSIKAGPSPLRARALTRPTRR